MHTRDKEDIAYRLFLGGLDVAYNISSLWKGPLPVNITHLPDTLVLNYGTTWTLELRQTEGFEVMCVCVRACMRACMCFNTLEASS